MIPPFVSTLRFGLRLTLWRPLRTALSAALHHLHFFLYNFSSSSYVVDSSPATSDAFHLVLLFIHFYFIYISPTSFFHFFTRLLLCHFYYSCITFIPICLFIISSIVIPRRLPSSLLFCSFSNFCKFLPTVSSSFHSLVPFAFTSFASSVPPSNFSSSSSVPSLNSSLSNFLSSRLV